MKKIASLGGALAVVVLVLGLSTGGATAATGKCGDYKKVENLVADGLSCGDAKKVVKVWIRLCNYEGRCVLEVGALGNEQFSCKGRKRGSVARIKCESRESPDVVKFTAPV